MRPFDGGARDDAAPPTPRPSQRVRLEVAFLDAEQAMPSPALSAAFDDQTRSVLVVAAEADFRHYVRECLRSRSDLQLIEAATVPAAVTLAAQYAPQFLVADEPEHDVLRALSTLPAIVIVDETPREAASPTTRLRLLARPFAAEQLLAEVRALLG